MPVQSAQPPPCQVYAVVEIGPGALERVRALLAATPLSSLLIAPRDGEALTAGTVKPLVDLGQKKNCAMLLADDAALARVLRADGVHLKPGLDLMARYEDARSILGAGAIVGVDVGASRHLAMQLGETGADYVGFSDVGVASAAPADDETVEGENLRDGDVGPQTPHELIAWWSEVFKVPCVAFGAASIAAASANAACGADFVAVRFGGGESVPASVERLAAIATALEAAYAE